MHGRHAYGNVASHTEPLYDTRGLLRLVRAADNIIIMAQGRVSAQGEPLALKAQFGEGYSLSLALKSHSDRCAAELSFPHLGVLYI